MRGLLRVRLPTDESVSAAKKSHPLLPPVLKFLWGTDLSQAALVLPPNGGVSVREADFPGEMISPGIEPDQMIARFE